MNLSQSQRSLANVCLFCSERLTSPSMCAFCGFKFCEEHKSTEKHQCIKTRYFEYVRKKNPKASPNIARGNFIVVCEMCGFSTSKGVPIEYAGEELVQHMQIVGCSDKVFLEETKDDLPLVPNQAMPESENKETIAPKQVENISASNNVEQQTSIVDQILKLSQLKEKGMISDEEFLYIKKELIKKLQ